MVSGQGKEYLVKAVQTDYKEDGRLIMVETTMVLNAENDIEACREMYNYLNKDLLLISNIAVQTRTIKMEV